MVKFHEYKMAQQMRNYYTEYIHAYYCEHNTKKCGQRFEPDVWCEFEKKKDWESYFKEGNGMETAKYKMIHDEKCTG